MSYDTTVLRAMLRLARRRSPSDREQLLVRVGGSEAELRAALRRLEKTGLVERTGPVAGRLTFQGLAVAVATVAATRPARLARRTKPVVRAKKSAA